MAKLIYSAIASLDGYTEDEQGSFGWSKPDPEVHAYVNDLERGAGTHLYGRRMYEVMAVWEDEEALADGPRVERDYGEIWRAAEKIVYSRSLESASTARTRLEREFDPKTVAAMKESAEADLAIGGPNLAAQALEAGLVDELNLFVSPVAVGGGKAALPDGLRLDLELLDERRFGNGVVHLHYRVDS